MENIQSSRTNQIQTKNQAKINDKNTIAYPQQTSISPKEVTSQDIFVSSNKNKKNSTSKIILYIGLFATAVVGTLLALKKGKTEKISIEDFKKMGGKFEAGKAIKKNGAPFSGELIKKTAKGDEFLIEYKEGLIQKSRKNFSYLADEYTQKEYSYTEDGKLREVVCKKIETFNKNQDKNYRRICYSKPENYCSTKVTSKRIYDDKKIQGFISDFTKTVEGKRRAKMSNDDILAETQNLLNQVFSEKNIDKNLTPKIKIIPNENIAYGGSYNPNLNVLEINPNSYRAGVFDLEDVAAHEGTHFEEALLRSRLSKDAIDNAAKNKLISRIFENEADEVVVNNSLFGAQKIKTPKLSEKMKKEFQEFAADNLYTNNYGTRCDMIDLVSNKGKAKNEAQEKLLSKITKLVDNNPDFISQYSSREEAIDMLINYSASHNTRFQIMTTRAKMDISMLPKLTPEEEKRALESLDGFLESAEGNARMGGLAFLTSREDINNYQFSREEVLAQQKGNGFAIEKLKAKAEQMKKDGKLTPQFEAYYNHQINRHQLTIEYKTKGQAWYKKYIQSLNNPNDTELKAAVEKEWEELSKIQEKIKDPLIPTGVFERVIKKISN